MGILLYLGYLAIFFATWTINGIDYNRIGENAETTKLWYALPTLFGCAFLVVAISILGWWRLVLFDKSRSGPRWIWILPVVATGIILNNFLNVPSDKISAELLLWSSLGAVGVGFGEEMITRGSMIVGLRSRFGESKVWLILEKSVKPGLIIWMS
jgi:membrane protease YdiL (CAAX protease family)